MYLNGIELSYKHYNKRFKQLLAAENIDVSLSDIKSDDNKVPPKWKPHFKNIKIINSDGVRIYF